MKKALRYEEWEARFVEICKLGLEEEPLYPFDQFYDQGLAPGEAFEKYLASNPDYAEKFQEVRDDKSGAETAVGADDPALGELSQRLAEKKKREEAAARLEQFCPNCARILGTKKICKCGYRRKKA